MKLGANDVSAVKIGATDVNKVYLGSNLVWQKSQLLLDEYPNAAAAYSLRKLRTAYTGDAIEVRRSSDNTTQDIGFDSNGELDTASLLTFVGAGSGYVNTLYDQSGQGNDATQSTASKQPAIVSSGVVNELNGKPTMTFLSPFLMDLNLSQYPFTSGGSATEKSIFAVAENDSTLNQNLYNIADTRDIYALTYNRSGNNTYGFSGANYGTIGGNITGQNIISSLAISPSSKTFNNAVEGVSSNLLRSNFNDISIGSRGGSYAMNGSIQEVVMYESNQSTNREDIESNVNIYYNIFWDGSQDGLLDDYPGAGAAYSLRALNSAYTGPAIEVRKTVGGVTANQDIGLLYDGSLDTEALLNFVGAGNDGFVSKWYDQSGQGNDATQATASAQPKIVSSGSTILENGKPVIEFDGSNDFFSFTNISTNNDYTGFQVVKRPATSTASVTMAGVNNNDAYLAWIFNDNTCYFRNSRGYIQNNLNTTTQQLLSSLNILLGNMSIYANGNLLKSASPTPLAGTDFMNTIGRRGVNYGVGNTQEIVFYPSDQSSNRTAIETNINDYYNVY